MMSNDDIEKRNMRVFKSKKEMLESEFKIKMWAKFAEIKFDYIEAYGDKVVILKAHKLLRDPKYKEITEQDEKRKE